MVPDVISTILAWVLGSVPRHDFLVLVPVSSQETPASRTGRGVRLVNYNPCNAISTGDNISGLQPFLNVQAPMLARPPGRTYRWDGTTLQPQGSRAVYTTQWTSGHPLELWHRYVPESGNWHGGTFTRWTVALSAATLPDVISASLLGHAWTHTPVGCSGARARCFPKHHRPSPRLDEIGFPTTTHTATSVWEKAFEAAVI